MLSVRSPGPAPTRSRRSARTGSPSASISTRSISPTYALLPRASLAVPSPVRRCTGSGRRGGNPLDVRELLAAAAESGALVPDGGLGRSRKAAGAERLAGCYVPVGRPPSRDLRGARPAGARQPPPSACPRRSPEPTPSRRPSAPGSSYGPAGLGVRGAAQPSPLRRGAPPAYATRPPAPAQHALAEASNRPASDASTTPSASPVGGSTPASPAIRSSSSAPPGRGQRLDAPLAPVSPGLARGRRPVSAPASCSARRSSSPDAAPKPSRCWRVSCRSAPATASRRPSSMPLGQPRHADGRRRRRRGGARRSPRSARRAGAPPPPPRPPRRLSLWACESVGPSPRPVEVLDADAPVKAAEREAVNRAA